jgi:hypothetical protein
LESPTRPIDACITGHRDPNAERADVIPTTNRPWSDPTNRQRQLAVIRTITWPVALTVNSARSARAKASENGTSARWSVRTGMTECRWG